MVHMHMWMCANGVACCRIPFCLVENISLGFAHMYSTCNQYYLKYIRVQHAVVLIQGRLEEHH